MNIYIQTRGVMKDYQFLGKSPENSWWMAYKDYTSFEHPTIILESTDLSGWRLYLSGMPSSRLDKVNTPIRYTLVLEDSKPIEELQLNQILGLIQTWATAVYDESEKEKLKTDLDKLFTLEDIENYFSSLGSDDIFDLNIMQQFNQWLDGFPSNINGKESAIENSYLGSIQTSQQKFLQRCKNILQGTHEKQAALYLNFIESKQELESTKLVEDEHYKHKFMIVLNNEKETWSEINIKKKIIQLPQTQPTKPLQSIPDTVSKKKPDHTYNKWMWMVIGGVLVAVIIIVLL